TTTTGGETTTTTTGCSTTTTTGKSTSTTAGGTTQTKAAVVGDPNVKPGQQVTFQGGGFAKNAPLALEFQSTPTPLGNTTADASGNFKATVTIPNDATGGAHHLVARGPGANGGTNEAVGVVVGLVGGLGHMGRGADRSFYLRLRALGRLGEGVDGLDVLQHRLVVQLGRRPQP